MSKFNRQESKYNLKFLKQEQYSKGSKFETVEVKDMGDNYTWDNIELATSDDTLRFFRKSFKSKQKVTMETNKDDLYVVKIYSYEPNRLDKRTVHVYTEVKE